MPRKKSEIELRQKTQQEELEDQILATLAALGGQRIRDETLRREGNVLILPETMTPQDAVAYLREYIEQQETETRFEKTFRYRPHDGAHAMHQALLKVFGMSGIGKAHWEFFTKVPPQMITVNTGVNQTTQVPWGVVAVPMFEGQMYLNAQRHKEWGQLFQLIVDAPRKFQAHIEGMFRVIEEELESGSIYRGRAIDGQSEADFLDLTGVDRSKVIYSDEVVTQLDANVWSVVRHTQQLRALDIPRKRAVLLEGPYGTGKTLAAFLTAQEAVNNGWTFIYCRPGKDNLHTVMQTARLYQPAVVFYEDVDTMSEGTGNAEQGSAAVAKLLDVFDGITAKNTEIMVVLTTNHRDRIHKALIRPGRLDAMITIAELDTGGIMRMIRATVPDELLSDNLDEDRIGEAMANYLPAFAKESIDRAMRYSLARNNGAIGPLTTEDFVAAAAGLRPQLDLMQDASEGKVPDALGGLIRSTVEDVVQQSKIHEIGQDDPVFEMQLAGNGGRE
jgi:transitional endoplasmic reticulum ATPase